MFQRIAAQAALRRPNERPKLELRPADHVFPKFLFDHVLELLDQFFRGVLLVDAGLRLVAEKLLVVLLVLVQVFLAAGLRAVVVLLFQLAGLRAVVLLVALLLATGLRAVLFAVKVFRAAGLRAVLFAVKVFWAVGFRAVVLRAVGLRAVLLRAAVLGAVLLAVDLRAVLFRAVVLRAVVAVRAFAVRFAAVRLRPEVLLAVGFQDADLVVPRALGRLLVVLVGIESTPEFGRSWVVPPRHASLLCRGLATSSGRAPHPASATLCSEFPRTAFRSALERWRISPTV